MEIDVSNGLIASIDEMIQRPSSASLAESCKKAIYTDRKMLQAPCCGAFKHSIHGLNHQPFATFVKAATMVITLHALDKTVGKEITLLPATNLWTESAPQELQRVIQIAHDRVSAIHKSPTTVPEADLMCARMWMRALLSCTGFVTANELLCDDANGILYGNGDDTLAIGDAVGRYVLTSLTHANVHTANDILTRVSSTRRRCREFASKDGDTMMHLSAMSNQLHLDDAALTSVWEDSKQRRAQFADEAQRLLHRATASEYKTEELHLLEVSLVISHVAATLLANLMCTVQHEADNTHHVHERTLVDSLDRLRSWERRCLESYMQRDTLGDWDELHHTLHELTPTVKEAPNAYSGKGVLVEWVLDPMSAVKALMPTEACRHLDHNRMPRIKRMLYDDSTLECITTDLHSPEHRDSPEATLRIANEFHRRLLDAAGDQSSSKLTKL